MVVGLIISHVAVFAAGIALMWIFGGRIRKEIDRQAKDLKDIAQKVKEIGDVIIHD